MPRAVDLSSLPSGDEICSDTSHSHRRRRDMAGISEDKATGTAYGGRRGRRAGRAATAARGGGAEKGGPPAAGIQASKAVHGMGAELPAPHLLSAPSQQLCGGCIPHFKLGTPLPMQGYPQPPKSIRLCPGRGAAPGGAGAQPSPPSPSWKAASGLYSAIPAF